MTIATANREISTTDRKLVLDLCMQWEANGRKYSSPAEILRTARRYVPSLVGPGYLILTRAIMHVEIGGRVSSVAEWERMEERMERLKGIGGKEV